MKWIDIFRMAFGNLARNKMRTSLTVMGVIVGIGAIIFLVSLGFGLQQLMINQVANLDALTVVTVRPNVEKNIIINQETIDKFKGLADISDVSPLLTYPAQVSAVGGDSSETIINGIVPKYVGLEDVTINAGNDQFSGEEAQEAVLSGTVIKNLKIANDSDVIGKEYNFRVIQLDDSGNIKKGHENDILKLKIIGVSDESKFTYVPLNLLKKLGADKYSSVKVKVVQRKQVAAVRKTIESMGYPTNSVKDTVDQIENAFVIVRTVLFGFGFIALSVAAIGIFNTMTISLLERTHEIGIMKAIGGRDKDVSRIFTAEASMIGFLGGVFGVVSGWLLGQAINLLVNFLATSVGGQPNNFFYMPLDFAGYVVLFAFGISTLAGVWPARRAAKLNPLEALRYE